MKIEVIKIKNFRGIEELRIQLNPKFNLLIGENGAGKTAILEAIAVGMSSFFLGMPGIPSRNIRDEDIRYFKTPDGSYEFATNTKVEVEKGWVESPLGVVITENKSIGEISWYKERNGITGKTLNDKKSLLKMLSQDIYHRIGDSKRTTNISLPVLAYYSTARLWKEARENKKGSDKEDDIIKNLPSRYRGYRDALEITSTFKIMLDWFESKFLDQAVNKSSTFQLECVKNAIISNIQGATDIKWYFEKDRIQTLYICFDNGKEIPFSYLSDGYRNLLAIFSDLAWRCVTLNPHFGVVANLKTEGMVLIDELDLHLHPAWQKTIVKQLKDTFPKIQFVANTHSPFIIQETEEGELYKINDNGEISIGGADDSSLEDIAEYIQKVANPAWSIHKKEMYVAAKEYFDLLNQLQPGTSNAKLNQIRERLNVIGKPYSDNLAYIAFLEQKRFLAEEKLKA